MSEAQIKAMDKRISGMERSIESMEKTLRQVDVGSLLKTLNEQEKKIARLEALIVNVATSLKNPKAFLEKGGVSMLSATDAEKIAHAISAREAAEISKRQEKIAQEMSKTFISEARFKILEAKIAGVEQFAKAAMATK